MELQDTYLRLDLTIADFLNYLDTTVGKGNYLMFLTADHACAENGNFMHNSKYDVKNIDYKTITKSVKQFSKDTFGDDLVLSYSNFNLFLDKKKITEKGLQFKEVRAKFIDYFMTQEQVKRVYTEEEITNANGNDYYLNAIFNGYDVTQNGDLVILDKPGYIEYGATGTTHGTPYAFDTHAPLLFYGWNIKKGNSHDKKYITQIAPTIAQKIGITFPNGSQCEVLSEILGK
jgi:hypothetical protein